jgi:putative transposase
MHGPIGDSWPMASYNVRAVATSFVSARRIASSVSGSPACGAIGDRLCSSSSPRPSSPGIAKAFDSIGDGRVGIGKGRPPLSSEVRNLIRQMSLANPRWGAPRIHGELLKIGIEVSQATVAKYTIRHPKPPSQTWRTFLKNHAKSLVAADFFVVPTIAFQLLFVFAILDHDRRRPIHFAVTSHPTEEWTARQLLDAFPWDSAPRHLLRDRDGCYGDKFQQTAKWMGIDEVLTAPRSPWQNAYVERFIGSVRCECLDHVMVFHETGLPRILKDYFQYYEGTRTHLSLDKDAPISRPVQPPVIGRIVEVPQVGGLHHRYERIAASMGTRFLAQRLDCLPCLCLQYRSGNGFVPVAIVFGYRRGLGTVRPARMEFLIGTRRIICCYSRALSGFSCASVTGVALPS